MPVGKLGLYLFLFGAAATAVAWVAFKTNRNAPAISNAPDAPVVSTSGNSESFKGVAPVQGAVRIATGVAKSYVDHAGNEWLADSWFSGGGMVSSPNSPISFTRDAGLYRARREGDFRYDIPLRPGTYELWLHFAETVFGPLNPAGGGETSRIFDVFVNGEAALQNFDVIADAGSENKADIRVIRNVWPAEDGELHVEFRNQKSGAILSGLELFPCEQGGTRQECRPRALRVRAFDHAYRNELGMEWEPDRFFQGGVFITRAQAVRDTIEPELFAGERYGNFQYEFPVAAGEYKLRLLFSERWFGPSNPGGGGEKSRIFDVYCNGEALLRNFDIYEAADGENRPVERVFRRVRANAQGKIRIAFVPIVNYACVNAIAVEPEP